MILDRLDRASAYAHLFEGLSDAFVFLMRRGWESFPEGRVELKPSRLYAHIERARGRSRAHAPLEAHRVFADVQYVVEGRDIMGWRDLASCMSPKSPYDKSRDLVFFEDPPLCWFEVPAGYFTLFLPDDAHAPLAGDGPVFKVVVKVRLV
ncbi:MAG: YhcH/YjgK/YiaL family protein [Kiritimatiellae bacterium]|nr:YhcH/YjgK/YiaL family protein [Kiritimatiellia bacterium]MDW8457680.1 YhcH/YjgK/YiaL family protein [Verrucomicrobiota bacterium]